MVMLTRMMPSPIASGKSSALVSIGSRGHGPRHPSMLPPTIMMAPDPAIARLEAGAKGGEQPDAADPPQKLGIARRGPRGDAQ